MRFCVIGNFPGKIECTVDGDVSGGAETAVTVNDNNWHHIAYVVNGNSQTIYLDGSISGTATETLSTNSGKIRIGSREFSSSYYQGLLDQVRIYNRSLTQEEIQSDMNTPIGACIHKSDSDCSGCVSKPELFAFIDLWKVDSSNPTLKELIEAIGLWKRGGC